MVCWLSIEAFLPRDDDTVFAININYPQVVPVLCYFDAEDQEFYQINTIGPPYPIKITHWMNIPDYPE